VTAIEDPGLHLELVAELRRTHHFLQQQMLAAFERPATDIRQLAFYLEGLDSTASLLEILGEQP
jgi:hypothetical protein